MLIILLLTNFSIIFPVVSNSIQVYFLMRLPVKCREYTLVHYLRETELVLGNGKTPYKNSIALIN